MSRRPAPETDLMARLVAARDKVAYLVVQDEIYLPIFERLEREIAIAEATRDSLSRARAIVARQKAMDCTTA